jgi:hypothetical protein
MKTKIEIYEKATGQVIEIQEVTDMKAFKFYWARQCDTETFAWREVK